MRHGSLFSGIGGFDLAAEWMGWENVFHCENNSFCQKILKYYWPDAKSYGDIKETDFSQWKGSVDIISGGFPCQPYSQAGKRKGKEDERHLWPEMLRAISEVQPRWIVGENVSGLLNWGRGMVLDEIKADLEATGFKVFPPLVLPACAVNAPHRRDRLWIIAHSDNKRLPTNQQRESVNRGKIYRSTPELSKVGDNAANANGQRQQGPGESKQSSYTKAVENREKHRVINDGKLFNPHNEGERLERRRDLFGGSQSNRRESERWIENWIEAATRLCCVDDGISGKLDTATVSKSEWRKQSLMGFGNAVVPQVVYEIFKAIEKTDGNN